VYREGHLKCNIKEITLWDDIEQDGSAKYFRNSRREEGTGKRSRRKKKAIADFSPIEPHKTKTTAEEQK
jgi:hypothetical protein